MTMNYDYISKLFSEELENQTGIISTTLIKSSIRENQEQFFEWIRDYEYDEYGQVTPTTKDIES